MQLRNAVDRLRDNNRRSKVHICHRYTGWQHMDFTDTECGRSVETWLTINESDVTLANDMLLVQRSVCNVCLSKIGYSV